MNETNLAPYKKEYSYSNLITEEAVAKVEMMRKKMFRLREAGITPYMFNQWKNGGLVDEPTLDANRKWVSLTFSEWIWLKIITDLRKFGCSTEDILNIKKNVLAPILKHPMSQENEKAMEKAFFEALEKSNAGKIVIDDIKKYMKEHGMSITEYLKKEQPRELNLLECMISNMVITNHETCIIAYINDHFSGVAGDGNMDKQVLVRKRHKRKSSIIGFIYSDGFKELETDIDHKAFLTIPHIKIPLSTYVREFMSDAKNEKNLEALNLLSKEELILLKEMRKGNVSKITIHYSKDHIDRIDVTKPVRKMAESRIIETFMKDEFANIEYVVEKGQIVKFSKTTKIIPSRM
jgi:hypothetical protein